MDAQTEVRSIPVTKELGLETFLFPLVFFGMFTLFASQMGLANALNTMMNTAYQLLIDTVLYITAICVIMGAVSALLSEFGFVSLANRVLQPLMKPVYGLPGAASLAVVTTFLSDNPAILTLADDQYFRHYFKVYQFPALTNLGTAFGMGLIVCTYMYSLSPVIGPGAGAAYEGIRLLPALAEKADFILGPLFGFSSAEAIGGICAGAAAHWLFVLVSMCL